jgi:hypothetical protein|tara:strand:+ start:752 stop:1042 length:291 start_codon:yes stop_codon:yes gene_type:complete
MSNEDKKDIDKEFDAQAEAKDEISRKAWRGTMLAAVGSLAFFLSTVGNVHKTWQSHGNPLRVVEIHDLALFSVPIFIIGYFLVETSKSNGDDKVAA